MRLNTDETLLFQKVCDEFIEQEPFTQMKNYKQHGFTTTYDHCISVSYYGYYFARRLHIPCDDVSLIRGALLHDLFLYDWHEKDRTHRWHGFYHSKKAHDNATTFFDLNEIEKNIILTHMWPLTFRSYPKKREAIIICMVDKFISILETLHIPCNPMRNK